MKKSRLRSSPGRSPTATFQVGFDNPGATVKKAGPTRDSRNWNFFNSGNQIPKKLSFGTPPAGGKAKLWALIPFAAYAAILFVLFRPVLWPPAGFMLFGDDIAHQYWWYRLFLRESLARGVVPWWDPYTFSGMPFLANPVINLWYIPNFLYLILPLPLAFPAYIVLHIFWGMAGMYRLMRRWLPSLPSWVCGIIFGLSGYFSARIAAGHVCIIGTSAWVPWVFMSFLGIIDAGRSGEGRQATITSIIRFSVVLGMQLLAGYQSIVLYTLEAVGFTAVVYSIYKRSLSILLRLAVSLVITFGLTAFAILPMQELVYRSIRDISLPYEWSAKGALTYQNFFRLINPYVYGDYLAYKGPGPNYYEHAMYLGKIGLVLAAGSIVYAVICVARYGMKRIRGFHIFTRLCYTRGDFQKTGRRSSRSSPGRSPPATFQVGFEPWGVVVLFAVIAVGTLWISFANNARIDLYHVLWSLILQYRFLRIPPRHLVLFVFAASALAGFGLAAVRRNMLQLVLAAAITVEMVVYAGYFIVLDKLPDNLHDKALIALLTKDTDPYRVLQNFGVWYTPRTYLDFPSVGTYGIFSATGYDTTILKNYYSFFDALAGNTKSSIMEYDVQVPFVYEYNHTFDALNVKYLYVSSFYDLFTGDDSGNVRFVLEDKEKAIRVYENMRVLPRFYFVKRSEVYESRDEVLAAIRAKKHDLSSVVLYDRSSLGELATQFRSTCGNEQLTKSVTIRSYSINTIELAVSAPCGRFLVSSEVMYPGWEAYIDGEKVPIIEGNGAFRTLFVPEGEHKVVFRYNPKIFLYGGLVTITTAFICFVFCSRVNAYEKRKTS